jgi:multisubunit Na+/H+ antiporter MnhF subunit
MSPFRPDRGRRGEDRLLGEKMMVFMLGAAIAIGGIATDRDWLVYVALGLLVLGLAMRFVGRDTGAVNAPEAGVEKQDDDDEGPDDPYDAPADEDGGR